MVHIRQMERPVAARAAMAGALLLLCLSASVGQAGVYHSRESALTLAFPEADSVTTRSVTLTAEDAERASTLAGARLPSRLVRIYEAWEDGQVVARGIIDTHKIRSLPETLLIVADARHRVRAVHLLAFHEPEQYQAARGWFSQFRDRALDTELAVQRGIAGIAGSTLTAQAVTAAVRRALATLQVVFGAAESHEDLSKTSATANPATTARASESKRTPREGSRH